MRYYFHLHNDMYSPDEEGVELDDIAAAREHAEQEARIMAAESVRDASGFSALYLHLDQAA